MDKSPITAARQLFTASAAGLSIVLLGGCATMGLSNLTPSSLPENPSGIYTFSLRVTPKTVDVVPESIAPHIIVNGASHDMVKDPSIPGIYEYDAQLPAGATNFGYYFLVGYQLQGNGVVADKQAFTELEHASVVSRYVLSLEVNRAPVGSRIGILGRGFTPTDRVAFDGSPVRTVYESPTSLGFFVPAMNPGKTYRVSVSGSAGNSDVGTFRIDAASLQVDPASLTLSPGQKQDITFSIGQPAGSGGLLLDVTTDVPESVIMPEVIVPEGRTSVTIAVEGGKPGTGSLFLKGYGGGEVSIPITVSGH